MKFPDTLRVLVLVLAPDLAYLAQSRTDCTASVVENALSTRARVLCVRAVSPCESADTRRMCVREIKAGRTKAPTPLWKVGALHGKGIKFVLITRKE